jgi:hypothetical protein
MFLESRARQVREADVTATVCRLPEQCGILNISEPYKPPRLVTRIGLLFLNYRPKQNVIVFCGHTTLSAHIGTDSLKVTVPRRSYLSAP